MSAATGLRACTRVGVGDAPDLVAVAGDTGYLFEGRQVRLAGRGTALRFAVDRRDPRASATEVADTLAALRGDDDVGRPGTGPVALGAWPFDPDAPGELVVPSVTVGVADDGRWWTTTVTAGDGHERLAAETLEGADTGTCRTLAGFSLGEPLLPNAFDLRASRRAGDWCASVAAARDELRAGVADKVVLAREIVVHADGALPVGAILRRLRSGFPDCLRFSVDGFVGASPELLVARHGDEVLSHPMAGTAPRSGDPQTDARLAAELFSSDKNRVEHRHTIDLVHDSLLPYCSYLDEEAEPSVVAMANVQHLATRVEGQLSRPAASVVELVGVLHPTPAVCGRPRLAALTLIDRYEGFDRGPYGGPVGWVDSRGNGAWAVGIRSARVSGPTATVCAGVGVVGDSEPALELAETRAKLQAMLGVLVRP